ncbi:hypothetical protein FV217_15205 [Methylobacterium sp. WL9]|nr:hypothetical protein FV217_15205 [Methylobacterium sp. WL9]
MDPVVHEGIAGEAEAKVRGGPKGAFPTKPPRLRLPPRRADDEVVAALSPQAGRGDARTRTDRLETA